jgi:hypothetical protein
MRCLGLIGFVLAAVCASAASASAPALPLSQVDVSHSAGAQAETTIAVSPADPRVLLAGSNHLRVVPARLRRVGGKLRRTGGGLEFDTFAYSSVDGGATWTLTRPYHRGSKNCAGGDPVTAIDDTGRELIGYMVMPCRADESGDQLALYVSRRAGPGRPWIATRVPAPTGPDGPANDKPAIAWDSSAASPHHGRVYLAWTRIKRSEIAVVISHSDDGGATWSAPVPVSRAAGPSTRSFFATVTTSPAGDVYVGWTTVSHDLELARSTDGGDTFATPVDVDSVVSPPSRIDSACVFRGQAIPAQPKRCASINPGVAATASRVYVTYAVTGPDGHEQDVRVATLDPALNPVGEPVQVNPPDGAAVSDQFQPAVAVDAASGLLWVCFYDTAGDDTRQSTRYSCAVSRDGSAWSAPVAVARVRSNENGRYANREFEYGDYQGLAVGSDGVAHPIWTDSRELRTLGEEIYTTALDAANLGY